MLVFLRIFHIPLMFLFPVIIPLLFFRIYRSYFENKAMQSCWDPSESSSGSPQKIWDMDVMMFPFAT